MSLIPKPLIAFCSVSYLALMIVLGLADLWPDSLWWLANMIEILPLWVLLIPPIFLFIISVGLKLKRQIFLNICSLITIIFFIMNFNIPLALQHQPTSIEPMRLRIMTANIGGRENLDLLWRYIQENNPDIIAFQETGGESQGFLQEHLSREGWTVEYKEQLGIATRLRIIDSDYKTRQMFGRWGPIIAKFFLQTPQGTIYFFPLHLETPREGIEAIMEHKLAGLKEMKRVTEMQKEESELSSQWVKDSSPVIIAGDFNMLSTSPMFKKFWGEYHDAFVQKGIGFGYTKHTRWHGARIDHILVDRHWRVNDVKIGPDLKGDHRPVIADLEFVGSFTDPKDLEK